MHFHSIPDSAHRRGEDSDFDGQRFSADDLTDLLKASIHSDMHAKNDWWCFGDVAGFFLEDCKMAWLSNDTKVQKMHINSALHRLSIYTQNRDL